MPYRVRLTWNRNQDTETEYYRIFRAEEPIINEQNRMEYMVARVAHPKKVNPINIKEEGLIRISSRSYLLAHKNILTIYNGVTYPFTLLVDGVETMDFILDAYEGHVLFNQDIDPQSEVKVAEYTFDGVQVWDYGLAEDGKIYYGPEAKDSSAPSSPRNLTLETDYARNRLLLRWASSKPTGKTFYYRIDASVNSNHYSKLTERKTTRLQEPLADRAYTIERSQDGIKWQEIARIKGTVFYEYMVDRKAPNPVSNLSGNFYLYPNTSLAQITLNWDRVFANTDSQTSLYRVRATNRVGSVSDVSNVVGPIPFSVGLKEIVIRRKEYDGTLPTFNGSDAITVAHISDITVTRFIEDVSDNKKYIYGIWVVDQAENYSPVTFTTIDIGDATPPVLPMNLTAEQFQLSVG